MNHLKIEALNFGSNSRLSVCCRDWFVSDLYVYRSTVFSACYHWWICLLVWLLSSSVPFIFLFITIIFSIFFLPFLLSHLADTAFMLRSGVRPELLRRESQVQDTGSPKTSWPHVISIGKSSPRNLHLNAKAQLHPTASKLQCWTPHAKQLEKQEHNPTH